MVKVNNNSNKQSNKVDYFKNFDKSMVDPLENNEIYEFDYPYNANEEDKIHLKVSELKDITTSDVRGLIEVNDSLYGVHSLLKPRAVKQIIEEFKSQNDKTRFEDSTLKSFILECGNCIMKTNKNKKAIQNIPHKSKEEIIITFSDGVKIEGDTKNLSTLKSYMGNYLEMDIDDFNSIDIVFAVVITCQLSDDPLWLMIVGAPSTLKTELIRGIRDSKYTYSTSSLNKKSLISGFERNEKCDLLPKLNFKCFLMKDFTTILGMPKFDRGEIISTFRDAYDGYSSRDLANLGQKGYESHFNFLTGVTPAIENHYKVMNELGQRFLLARLSAKETVTRKEIAMKALDNTNQQKMKIFRNEYRRLAVEIIEAHIMKDSNIPEVPTKMKERIALISEFVTRVRTNVPRDSYQRDLITYVPTPEGTPRFAKQLIKLLYGLTHVRDKKTATEEEFNIVKKVAWDCLPSIRANVIKNMYNWSAGELTNKGIQGFTKLPQSSIKYILDDLKMLKVVKSHKSMPGMKEDGKSEHMIKWKLEEDIKIAMDEIFSKG